ncbi:MAG: SGNH/GDSL hydrolase family protein [Ekhidna sp.]|uniref:SGNH/GDSL hydrolase family protein n=1 Tax=Ekhidna sp. TaxID=2608089 RepID=UPI0032EE6A64
MLSRLIGKFLVLVAIIYSCGSSSKDDNPLADDTIQILFLGNSLTYFNDLPSLVAQKAKEQNVNIKTEMIAFPNYALEDHWNDGKVQKQMKTGKYKYLVIQQGPSSQEYGRETLFEYGAKLKQLCDQNNAELVYFMVWPSQTYYYTFDGVIKNHRDAAIENDAILCPVGEVWKAHFDETEDFSYYGSDGFHPSQQGSEVAAEVIVETLFNWQ